MNISAVTAVTAPQNDPVLLKGDIIQSATILKENGYNGIEIHLRSPSEINAEALLNFCNKERFRVSAFATGMIKRVEGLSLIDDRDYVRHQAVSRLEEFMILAEMFNASVIIGSLRGNIPDKTQPQKYFNRFYNCMESVLNKAQKYNVTMLLEVINRYENNYLNTAAETLEFIKPIESPNLKINLDTFHMNIEETDMAQAILMCGDKLGHIHIADNTRGYVGSGTINFADMLKAAESINYKGFYSLECLPENDALKALNQSLKNFKNIIL